MSFKVMENKLLKEYPKIWEKVSNLMNIKFHSEPILKAKIKLYGNKINTHFQGIKIPKENASYKCLSLIMLDSVIRANKKYYPQTLLDECKYVMKNNKMENLISDDLDLSSFYESDNESDNEFDLIIRLIINFDNRYDNDERQDCVSIIIIKV